MLSYLLRRKFNSNYKSTPIKIIICLIFRGIYIYFEQVFMVMLRGLTTRNVCIYIIKYIYVFMPR